MLAYSSAPILFTNVFATKDGSLMTLLMAIKVSERKESAVKNLASCGKTPPFIRIDSTAKGKELTSTSILSTTCLIFTKGKSGSEIKR